MRKLINRNSCSLLTIKRFVNKQKVWECSCGYIIPKKGTKLSGYTSCSQGFHVHCPKCGKVVAQFVNPK